MDNGSLAPGLENLLNQSARESRRAIEAEQAGGILEKHLFEACKVLEENNLLPQLSKAVNDWFKKEKAWRDGSAARDLQSVSMEILRNGFPPRNEQAK